MFVECQFSLHMQKDVQSSSGQAEVLRLMQEMVP